MSSLLQRKDSGSVLITGASSGIGKGYANAFAELGFSLILTARREELLIQLQDELQSKYSQTSVSTIPADLTDESSVQDLMTQVAELNEPLFGLINNAGLGYEVDLHHLSEAQLSRLLKVNVLAASEVMRSSLNLMRTNREGFVLNIASTTAFLGIPHFSAYAASKAYLLNLSESVHEEMKGEGVTVCCQCPGPVDTEFYETAGMGKRAFSKSQPVDEVVAAGLSQLKRGSAIGYSSWGQWAFATLADYTPRWAKRKAAARVLEWNAKQAQ